MAKRKASPQTKSFTANSVLAELKRLSTKATKEGMTRFGIPSDNALGVAVGDIRDLGKKIGKQHELALELWKTGVYEARMLCAFIEDPTTITSAQMDEWCRDFDSWAICDTLCFHLYDKTPHAWKMIRTWAKREPEFEKRSSFALLASVALHDKQADDELFAESLELIANASDDERNFVKKGVSWALRGIGGRNVSLHGAAMALAESLSNSESPSARWIGKDALRDLKRPLVKKKVAKR